MWQQHTDLRATRYLQSCQLGDLLSFMEFLAPEDSSSLSSSLQSLPRTIINILQDRDLLPSVLLDFEGKLDCERFRRYWTSEYSLWLYSQRQTVLQARFSERAATELLTDQQQDILNNVEDWTPADMCRVIADYWNLAVREEDLGILFTQTALRRLGESNLMLAQREKGDCWTYRTQRLAAEMLSMLAPGLGYNMKFSSWKDATGDAAKHVSDAEAEDSIAYAITATQGPQQLLGLLEGCDLVRYLCERVPDLPAPCLTLLHDSASHAFVTKVILAVWKDDQGNTEVCLTHLIEEEKKAAYNRRQQDEKRGRHAHAALQTLMQDLERDAQVEDPHRGWQLGSASADDVMGAARHFLQQMAAEELRHLLMCMKCRTIEMDNTALQTEQGREAAVGWVLHRPDCTPKSVLHITTHSALQSYLFGLTSDDAWLGQPQAACIKSILDIWGRPRSGEQVRRQGSRRQTTGDSDITAAATGTGAPSVDMDQDVDSEWQEILSSEVGGGPDSNTSHRNLTP